MMDLVKVLTALYVWPVIYLLNMIFPPNEPNYIIPFIPNFIEFGVWIMLPILVGYLLSLIHFDSEPHVGVITFILGLPYILTVLVFAYVLF